MKPEPLKGKGFNPRKEFQKFTNPMWEEWNETKASKRSAYFEDDIHSAVEWLKEQFELHYNCEMNAIKIDKALEFIDKAFEDVVKEKWHDKKT